MGRKFRSVSYRNGAKVWFGLVGHVIGPVGSRFEHVNEPSIVGISYCCQKTAGEGQAPIRHTQCVQAVNCSSPPQIQ